MNLLLTAATGVGEHERSTANKEMAPPGGNQGGAGQKTDPQRLMEVSAVSSLPLASIDGGLVQVPVIRKAAWLNARPVDLAESEAPSLSEQRAQRRRLRSLAPDKRSGFWACGMTRQPEPRQPGRTRSTGGPSSPDRPHSPRPARPPYQSGGAA